MTVDGKLPDEDGYALTCDMYAAVRQDAQPNDAETVFVNWLATEKGMAWLHEAIQGTLTQETQMPDAS